jgi:hypothetical protein
MRGIIFTSFLDIIQKQFGDEMIERVITLSDLENNGSYTSVGNYPSEDLMKMLTVLSSETATPIDVLLHDFGRKLFFILEKIKPKGIADCDDPMDFLSKIDSVIHAEVKKIYPDAKLPKIVFEQSTNEKATLTYSSCRPFAKVAEGLLAGCADFFNNRINVKALKNSNFSAHHLVFEVTRA